MIMLDNCTKIFFITPEDEANEESDEYNVYYELLYMREEIMNILETKSK